MAIVNISVNTETRESTLTVDGILVPATSCRLAKGTDYDGVPYLELKYTIKEPGGGGLDKEVEYSLPDPNDQSPHTGYGTRNGFNLRHVLSKDQLKEDLANFLNDDGEK